MNEEKNNDPTKFGLKKLLLIIAGLVIPIIGPILVIRSKRFKKPGKIIAGIWLALIVVAIFIPADDSNTNIAQEEVQEPKEQNKIENNEIINNENQNNQLANNTKADKIKTNTNENINVISEKGNTVEHNLNFSGKLNLFIEKNKIIMDINSNVADGGIFELTIMNSNLDVKSDFVKISNGKIKKEFIIPEDWPIGYYSGTAMFRFNLDEHPQPEKIRKIYGDKGEKLEGSMISETTEGGYIGNIETKTIAYPSEKAIKKKQSQNFYSQIDEIKKIGDGIILEVQPSYNDGDWKFVNVVVSDAWYYSAEHEKERFAEQVSSTIKKVIWNNNKIDKEESIWVNFVDKYDKTLAKQKMFGGYEIKR